MTKFLDPDDARLTAYALGELDAAECAGVEQLLAASPELQAELAEITNLAGMLRADLVNEPIPVLTTDLHQQLTRSVGPTTAARTGIRSRKSANPWAMLGSVAAAGFLLAGVALFTSIRQDNLRSVATGDRSNTLGGRRTLAATPNELEQSRLRFASIDQDASQSDKNERRIEFDSSTLVTEFNELFKQQRYVEAEIVAKKAKALYPKDPVGEQMYWKAVLGRRVASIEKLNREEESSFWTQLDDVEHAAIVSVNDKSPLQFGDDLKAVKSRRDGMERRKSSEHETTVRLLEAPDGTINVNQNLASKAIAEHSRAFDGERGSTENEKYEAPVENQLVTPSQQPLSTFSIDVDSASYSNVRRFLTQGQLPPPEAVRIEEMINYFNYSYPQPKEGEPFSVIADAAACPWQRDHYLARIALQARTIDKAKRPPTNLVFLLDVSGSMQAANKLPLVKQAMTLLCEELNQRDRIAIVTYAGDAGIKLASTPGSEQSRIMQVIESLQAGGSTNGAAGINVAYEEALKNFNGEGENRVILCTDGDFNVGISDDDQLVQLIQQQAKSKVFLSIFGFGMGNLKDAKLEKLADKGNGHYGYIDDLKEARRVFREELVGTLYTVAKDVKIQVEFNPLTVGAYRLIGYENRALAAKDFNDDTKDAGEIGAGHAVTALYEIVPKGQWPKTQPVDSLKYASADKEPAVTVDESKLNIPADAADDLFTVKLRYKQPTADTSVRTMDYVVDDIAGKKIVPTADFTWAAAVASFGMQLKHSQFKGQWTLNDLHEAAQAAKGPDSNGRRREFLDLLQAAKRLK